MWDACVSVFGVNCSSVHRLIRLLITELCGQLSILQQMDQSELDPCPPLLSSVCVCVGVCVFARAHVHVLCVCVCVCKWGSVFECM